MVVIFVPNLAKGLLSFLLLTMALNVMEIMLNHVTANPMNAEDLPV